MGPLLIATSELVWGWAPLIKLCRFALTTQGSPCERPSLMSFAQVLKEIFVLNEDVNPGHSAFQANNFDEKGVVVDSLSKPFGEANLSAWCIELLHANWYSLHYSILKRPSLLVWKYSDEFRYSNSRADKSLDKGRTNPQEFIDFKLFKQATKMSKQTWQNALQ